MYEDRLEGFHVFVGGGLGATHKKEETFPRLAEPLSFVSPEDLYPVLEAIVVTQRDLGNRQERRLSRMKYLLEKLGIDAFRLEVEARLGKKLPITRPFPINHNDFHRGWHRQKEDGLYYLGLFIENGRLRDQSDQRLRSGIREAVARHRLSVLLTPNQDLLLANVPSSAIADVEEILENHGIPAEGGTSPLRGASMACPALPTCGLAITEAERSLPSIVSQLEVWGYGDEPWNSRALWFPMKMRLTIVAVAAGATFSGWDNWVSTPPTDGTS